MQTTSPSGYVDLEQPHERYKLLEAIERIKRVNGIVILPPGVEDSLASATP